MARDSIIKTFSIPTEYTAAVPVLQLAMGMQRGPLRTTRGDWGYKILSASMVISDALACLFLTWHEHYGEDFLKKFPGTPPDLSAQFWRDIDESVLRAMPTDREPWEKRAKTMFSGELKDD